MQMLRLPEPVGDMVAASIYNHFILAIQFLTAVGNIKINSYPASHLISLKPSNGFQINSAASQQHQTYKQDNSLFKEKKLF